MLDKIMKPKISVIIPVYKVKQYLEQCVESVINQTYRQLEILLIDDGSPDECPAMCDDYAQRDERVVVVHKENGGLASARNEGLDHATGEYISFVDSDDWIELDMYEKMIQMIRDENLDILCCTANRISNETITEQYFVYYPTGTVLSGTEVTKEILVDRIGSQAVKGLYKRECWEGVRFPLGRLYEDIPTTFKAFAKAKRVGFMEDAFYNYRENEVSISFSPKPIKPYHEFLGFKEHYDYAKACFPDVTAECCALAAQFAISTCFHYYSERSKDLKPYVSDTEVFLNENKREIMGFAGHLTSRKLALEFFYLSKPLFKLFCRVFHVSGLQKALHFDVK